MPDQGVLGPGRAGVIPSGTGIPEQSEPARPKRPSAKPSVAENDVFLTGGTTTITDFADGFEGKRIMILCKHTLTFDFTTAQDSTHNLDGSSADITVDTGDILEFLSEDGTTWQLISNTDASADNN